MLTFETPSHRFNYRVAAIVENGRSVLLHKSQEDDFWALPGGRVEAGEDAATALVREFQEELDTTINVGTLALTVENFFEYDGSRYHELGLYFRATLPPKNHLLAESNQFFGTENGKVLVFEWFERESLQEVILLPSFLTQYLRESFDGIQHIVHRE